MYICSGGRYFFSTENKVWLPKIGHFPQKNPHWIQTQASVLMRPTSRWVPLATCRNNLDQCISGLQGPSLPEQPQAPEPTLHTRCSDTDLPGRDHLPRQHSNKKPGGILSYLSRILSKLRQEKTASFINTQAAIFNLSLSSLILFQQVSFPLSASSDNHRKRCIKTTYTHLRLPSIFQPPF